MRVKLDEVGYVRRSETFAHGRYLCSIVDGIILPRNWVLTNRHQDKDTD